ncbi:21361_t:CDS:2, partial [Rhizophagus irregularis]
MAKYSVTKPSCYIEFSETDIICSSAGPIYTKIIDSLKQYITSSGLNPKGAKLISNWIKKHSPNQLININEVIKKQPLGLWGGELGKLNSENFLEFFKMMAPRLCKYLNITQDEYLKLLNNCKDYEWDQYKPRMNYIRVWAMKV